MEKKGYQLGTFMKEFGTERKCREHLENLRWSGGFVCPKCGCRHACLLACPHLGTICLELV